MEQENAKVAFLKKITPWDKDGVAGQITFRLGNGDEVVVKRAEVSEANWERSAFHGISQRLGDSCASLSKGKEYGKAYEELLALKEQLATSFWTREREGGTKQQAKDDLVQALVKLKKQDEEVVRAAVEKASEETLKKWMGNAAVAAEMKDIAAKRAKAEAKGSNQTVDDIDLGLE